MLDVPAIDVDRLRELTAQGLGAHLIARALNTTRGAVQHAQWKNGITPGGKGGAIKQSVAPRTCKHCGQLFERQAHEYPNDFRVRMYCSRDCRTAALSVRHLVPAWSAADIERIRELAESGQSARQIASVFGATRNAIVGLAHRKGIKFHGSATLRYGDDPNGKLTMRRQPSRPKKPAPEQIEDANIPFEQRVAFLDLQPHHCKWPIGDLPDMMFCGAVREDRKPYCAMHEDRAHRCEPSARMRTPRTRPTANNHTYNAGFTTERRRMAAIMAWAKHKSQQRVGI